MAQYDDDFKRDALIRLRTNGGQVNKTARELGIATATMSRWAKQAGDESLLTRHISASAAEMNKVRNDQRRSELVEGLLDDAAKLRQQLFAETVYFEYDDRGSEWVTYTADEPTYQDKRHIAGAVKMLIGATIDIERHKTGGDAAAGLISELVGSLRAAHGGVDVTSES